MGCSSVGSTPSDALSESRISGSSQIRRDRQWKLASRRSVLGIDDERCFNAAPRARLRRRTSRLRSLAFRRASTRARNRHSWGRSSAEDCLVLDAAGPGSRLCRAGAAASIPSWGGRDSSGPALSEPGVIDWRLSRGYCACFGRRVYASGFQVGSESTFTKLRINCRIAGDIALSSRSARPPSLAVLRPLPFFRACFISPIPFQSFVQLSMISLARRAGSSRWQRLDNQSKLR
jgi:hypothetical protein